MADTTLSVTWKDHTSELATGYHSLLENNFLVDCTISAEGQSLKAHRLILSACSPYFQMLFCEEIGKHPFVILVDASFETLKAVIDFVYRGETQIAEGNLKAFLALAQSLQIKGLNAFSKNYKSKKLTCKTTENDFQGPSGDKQDICEVESVHDGHEENPGNFSQNHPRCSIDVEHSKSSVPFQGYSAPFGDERPAQEHPRALGCSEVPVDPEIIMKCEPVFEEFSETRNEIFDNINSNEPTFRTFASEIDGEASSVFVDKHLNQFPSCNESSQGNMDSSQKRPSQQQIMKLSCDQDVTRDNGPLLPVILVPKTEHLEDTGREESMDDSYEIDERTEPANRGIYSRTGHTPLENDLTSQQRSAMRLWSRNSEDINSFLAQAKLQLEERSENEPMLRNVDRSSSDLDAYKRTNTRDRPHICGVCGAAFANSSNLDVHKRTHTGTGHTPLENDLTSQQRSAMRLWSRNSEDINSFLPQTKLRPNEHSQESMLRNVERNTSSSSSILFSDNRALAGKRPFNCDICGAAFNWPSNLVVHKRTHTGERPYSCEECGKAFSQKQTLDTHMRIHTGERPYRCDVCGKAFNDRSTHARHKRRHTEVRR
ncbi:Kelch-like protein diablo [Gryllus bimaculatus]|nr:Kelch-like protein diablo [Gryllus bimaculatus]